VPSLRGGQSRTRETELELWILAEIDGDRLVRGDLYASDEEARAALEEMASGADS
jgi:hypothetical protein